MSKNGSYHRLCTVCCSSDPKAVSKYSRLCHIYNMNMKAAEEEVLKNESKRQKHGNKLVWRA